MNTSQRDDRRRTNVVLAAAAVFMLAVACYLLLFSGVPISDDEELYASAARNLAVSGTLSAEQLSGNLRLAGSYHGVEPAFSAVLSVWYRLFLAAPFGHLQTLYLLPMLCTALSAALIVTIAVQLGFSSAIGEVAGLLYALSSMAWPYAKTLFREPLIALLLLSSLSIFLWLVQEGRRLRTSVLMSLLLLLALVVLALTRVVMAAAAVALLIALPLAHPGIGWRKERLALAAGGGMLLIAGLAALGAVHATDVNIFYRFTGGFARDAITRLTTISHSHVAEALAAPLISPWKGLLFYSPICLVGFISLVANARRQPVVSLLTGSVLTALLVVQALAYDGEWWTPTWGSRFLLPAVPLLVTASLPILEGLAKRGRGGRAMLAGVFAAGLAIQLPAVLFNSAEFTAATAQKNVLAFPQSLIWDVAKTPIIAQWQAVASQEPDLLLWRTWASHPLIGLAACALAAGAILFGTVALRRAMTGSNKSALAFVACSAATLALATGMVTRAAAYDPAYEMTAFEPLCNYVGAHVKPEDVLIVQPYPGPAWQYLMNAECGQKVWYSMPYEDEPVPAAKRIDQSIPASSHYWLIQQFWSNNFVPEASSLALRGDSLLHEDFLFSPYHLFIGFYARGQP